MKTVRHITINNKGFVALLLLLCFLTTGFAKSLNTTVAAQGTLAKKQPAKQMFGAANEDASQSFLDTSDGDADDAHLFFHEPSATQKFSFAAEGSATSLSAALRYSENYNVALYDLYCNWKFHLG